MEDLEISAFKEMAFAYLLKTLGNTELPFDDIHSEFIQRGYKVTKADMKAHIESQLGVSEENLFKIYSALIVAFGDLGPAFKFIALGFDLSAQYKKLLKQYA